MKNEKPKRADATLWLNVPKHVKEKLEKRAIQERRTRSNMAALLLEQALQ